MAFSVKAFAVLADKNMKFNAYSK